MPNILIVVGIIFVSLVGLLTYSIMEPKKNTNFENTKRFAKDMYKDNLTKQIRPQVFTGR